jgi:colicin import membrane protein
LENRFVWFGKV